MDLPRAAKDCMVTTADLAARDDFRLGDVAVSPPTRTVRGPGGTLDVEPRVMQVLVVLADAAGEVVTRETLFNRCWGSVYVGDDSLNRAVAAVRRALADVGGKGFEIETIPRTGYRLTGAKPVQITGEANGDDIRKLSRRQLAGGAAAAVLGGGIWWGSSRWHDASRFDRVMARGDEAFRNGTAFEEWAANARDSPDMVQLYQQAVRLQPDSAKAWGLLGYFTSARAEDATKQDAPKVLANAEAAIQRALKLDPNEPNARVGMFLLQGPMLDWAARDRQLRAILATDPTNLLAMMELMPLLQAAGLTRESWMWNERMLRASPFMRAGLVIRGLKLWILGRVGEADKVIDRVRGLWPDYWFGNYARFIIFALTDRPAAARATLDEVRIFDGLQSKGTWLTALDALESRTPSAVETARRACLETARRAPPLANDMVMMLCALGLTDTAFEVTEGFLLWRGKFLSMDQTNKRAVDDYNRRMTQWLFTPPVAVMWADPRFSKLCDDFGLTAYWKARGVRPDYQVYG
jgi:DNA-binding winged helix-turn-helix (wHTH) protein/tetratricopeptide (TPR) repeat protein